MKTSACLFCIFLGFGMTFGQGVGIGTDTPEESAILDLTSTTQGVLVPRMTTAQRTAIPEAATGLLVFDMTTNSFWFRGGTHWIELIDSSNTVVHRSGPNLYMGVGGFVGVGTSTPTSKLDVAGDARVTGSLTVAGLAVGGIIAGGAVAAFGGAVGIGTGSPTAALEVASDDASEGIVHSDGNVRLATATTADGARISTTTNHPLHLTAANSPNGILITPLGAVGIGGVAAPVGMLDVMGNPQAPGIRHTDGNVTLGTRTTADAGILETVTNHALKLNANNGNDHLVITPEGNVGINTPTPSARLEVKSPTNFAGIKHTAGNVSLATRIGASKAKVTTTTSHPLELSANDMENQLTLDTSGNVGINTPTPSARLEVKSPTNFAGIKHTAGNVSLATRIGASKAKVTTTTSHPLELSANDMENQLTLDTSGNVGVGTANAMQKLHVAGNAVVNEKLGIGTTNPHGELQFANTVANRKAVLWESADDDHRYYGFGINPSVLRYQVDALWSSHVFYAAQSANSSAELMRITGQGHVGIGNSEPHAPLHFSNSLQTRKAVLREVADNNHEFYGFGTNAQSMRYQVGHDDASHIFYAAESAVSSKELMRITGEGRVGIGTAQPHAPLQFSNTLANRKAVLREVGDNDHEFYGFGTDAQSMRYQVGHGDGSHVFSAAESTSSSKELMRITGDGHVGIGTSQPHAPLQFSNTLANRKAVFREVGNNDHEYYGIGVNPKTMRYQVGHGDGSHIFYAAETASSSKELMRITGDGQVGIGTNEPTAALDVNGDTKISGQLVIGYEISSRAHEVAALSADNYAWCSCPPGTRAVGGGFYADNLDVYASLPDYNGVGWITYVNNLDIVPHNIEVYVICVRIN